MKSIVMLITAIGHAIFASYIAFEMMASISVTPYHWLIPFGIYLWAFILTASSLVKE